ncbi:MAG: hypothetical protein AUI14_03830 [Actinobacteria bacterium 13_2_20CM_2_71_6]|nr:MAG: hypothetical protein AUI14_03830 [Actinobacteria bacterium 13_2_20CM_2_71_6]
MREWLTLRGAAAYLKAGVSTLYRLMNEGKLRYYELESGGGRRFKCEALDRLLTPSDEDQVPRCRY